MKRNFRLRIQPAPQYQGKGKEWLKITLITNQLFLTETLSN